MSLIYLHLGLMSAAALAMITAATIARFLKKKKWWLKAHRALNLIAVILALGGLIAAAISVQTSGGPHFRVRHAFYGLAALLFLLASPALGFAIFKTKDKTKIAGLKKIHRWMGRITILLMLGAALAGFALIGLF